MFRNTGASGVVEEKADQFFRTTGQGLVDSLMGLGLFKWMTADVTGTENVKEQLQHRSGSSFDVNYKIKYKQHGSNDGVYKIAYLEIV